MRKCSSPGPGTSRSLAQAFRTVTGDRPLHAIARSRASRDTPRVITGARTRGALCLLLRGCPERRSGFGRRTSSRPSPNSSRRRRPMQPVMFEASEPLAFFDQFRIPYRQVVRTRTWVQSLARSSSIAIVWTGSNANDSGGFASFSTGLALTKRHEGGQTSTNRNIAQTWVDSDAAVALARAVKWLRGSGSLPGQWRPAEPVFSVDGTPVSAVWRDDGGSIFVPFDPSEVIRATLSEDYLGDVKASLESAASKGRGRPSPLLPCSSHNSPGRTASLSPSREPIPTSRSVSSLAHRDSHSMTSRRPLPLFHQPRRAPIPWISRWPRPYALGSHPHPRRRRASPDTKAFPCSAISRARHGYRSSSISCRCVTPSTATDPRAHREQVRGGSSSALPRRTRLCVRANLHRATERGSSVRRALEREGFRSPRLIGSGTWMRQLDFDYDSSYPGH